MHRLQMVKYIRRDKLKFRYTQLPTATDTKSSSEKLKNHLNVYPQSLNAL